MTLEGRYILAGHDASGKAIIKTDELLTTVPRQSRFSLVSLSSACWNHRTCGRA